MHNKMADRIICLLLMIAMASCLVLSADDLCQPELGYEMFIPGVKEDSRIGDVIGNVPISGTEEQVALNQTYNAYFDFNTTSRNIVVKAELDVETQDSKNQMTISCREKASSLQPVDISVTIILVDVNDNPPEFTQPVYYLNVSEGVDLHEDIVTNMEATDKDSGGNGLPVYSIVPGSYSDYFDIEDKLKTVLHLKKKLDYEVLKNLTLKLLAKDQPNGEVALSSTATLVITVLDADDLSPEFTEKSYSGHIQQNSPQDTVVNVNKPIRAVDPDVTINSPVKYSLFDPKNYFTIDANTAEVKVNQTPTSGTYTFIVEATQVDNELRKGTAILQILVIETGSNPPIFNRLNYDLNLPELTPQYSTILTLSATDKDFGENLEYNMETVQTVFTIDPISGEVKLNEPLDYENIKVYNLVATVTDGTYTSTAIIVINVVDVNDNDPKVKQRQITVSAERKPGLVLTTIQASDADENSQLGYELLSHTDLFAVSDEGVVSIIGAKDDLKDDRYDLVIEISDNGDTPRKLSTIVSVLFSSQPNTGAVVMAGGDDTLAIVFGALAAVLFVVIIILVLYIVRKRQQSTEHLNQAKLNKSLDPKGLKFQSHPPASRNPHSRINIDYTGNVDETSDGATTIQENPFNDDQINYGYVHSDSETDRDMDEIHIETAVIPYDAYNHNTEVYRDVGGLPNHMYQNGSLSTFKDNSSTDSINSESINSKKALVGNNNNNNNNNKRPAMHMMSWDNNNGQVPSMQSFDPDTSVTPVEEKPEITVYF